VARKHSAQHLSAPVLEIVEYGISRLTRELDTSVPFLSARVTEWITSLSPTGRAAGYFDQPRAFPMLLLPTWLAQSLQTESDRDFHSDVVYSSINAYYFVRLIDNVMDSHGNGEIALLPAAGIFQAEFMRVYYQYFEPAHPFWDIFRLAWFRTNEAAVRGVSITHFTGDDFAQISAAKLTAAQIPIAATAYRANRPDVIPRWLNFCDCLAFSFQMMDDVFDWRRDLESHQGSYFLSEARRRKQKGESVEGWIVREGISWGLEELNRHWRKLYETSRQLESPELSRFLMQRGKQLERDRSELTTGLRELDRVARILELSL
jgi:hypothetical protein